MERHGQVLDKKVVNNRQSTSGSELLILNSLHATNTFNKTELWAFAPLLLTVKTTHFTFTSIFLLSGSLRGMKCNSQV